jgi:hypothetical protein
VRWRLRSLFRKYSWPSLPRSAVFLGGRCRWRAGRGLSRGQGHGGERGALFRKYSCPSLPRSAAGFGEGKRRCVGAGVGVGQGGGRRGAPPRPLGVLAQQRRFPARTRQQAARRGGAQQALHEFGVGAADLGRELGRGLGAGLEALGDVEASDQLQHLGVGLGVGWGGVGVGRAAVPPGARGSGRPAAPTSVPKRPSLILHRPTRARLRPTRIFMMSTGLGSSALALASSWEGSGAGWSLMGASGAGPQRRRGARAGGAGARGRAELDRDPPRRSCGWWRCRPATAAASPSRSGCCCARVRAARGRSDVARRACGGARGENSAPAAGRGC